MRGSKLENNGVDRGHRGPAIEWRPAWLAAYMAGLCPVVTEIPSQEIAADSPTETDDPPATQWPRYDATGAKPCRGCGSPILFGEVESDEWGEATTLQIDDRRRRKWIVLDPDLIPHRCGGTHSARTQQ